MNLDNKQQYKKLDAHFVGKSIELLPDQMRQVLNEAHLIKIPKNYSHINNVVVVGMGGSNLGTHFTRSAFADKIKMPINIVANYHLPAFVDKNTLVLLSSYSGTTKEVLSACKEAQKRNCKIAAISEDSPKSKLKKIMMKKNLPGYLFKPKYNPSGQPRLGLGYSIFGQAVILAKTGIFSIKRPQMKDIIAMLEINSHKLHSNFATNQNAAKKIALKLHKKIPLLISAEHLFGCLHIMRNQFNECSKNFSAYLELPDLNHYTLEGLGFPLSNKKNIIALFFESNLFDKRVQKRSTLTNQVIKKNNIETLSYNLKSKDKLSQSFELLQLGAWISYYLGILNKIDPAEIPYVDWFKNQLKK
ncbi:MAG: SIS domain-containing protein [Patescibacteria group bacterium]|nr:SIS domain-containing protein [Patescibacteria group bacterium]